MNKIENIACLLIEKTCICIEPENVEMLLKDYNENIETTGIEMDYYKCFKTLLGIGISLFFLKIFGVLDLHWGWVLAPLWVVPACGLVFLFSIISVVVGFLIYISKTGGTKY